MSHPLIYRAHAIVLSFDDRLHYHINDPEATGYDSLDEVRRAIDALIDN